MECEETICAGQSNGVGMYLLNSLCLYDLFGAVQRARLQGSGGPRLTAAPYRAATSTRTQGLGGQHTNGQDGQEGEATLLLASQAKQTHTPARLNREASPHPKPALTAPGHAPRAPWSRNAIQKSFDRVAIKSAQLVERLVLLDPHATAYAVVI
jgi:hypothetical protein